VKDLPLVKLNDFAKAYGNFTFEQGTLKLAIEASASEQLDTADAVIRRTRALASIEAAKRPGPPPPSVPTTSNQVEVPLPDLSRFNQLLGGVDDSSAGAFYA